MASNTGNIVIVNNDTIRVITGGTQGPAGAANVAANSPLSASTVGATTTISLGTVPLTKGGTGQVTAAAAIAGLLPTYVSGEFLTNNGTALNWGAVTSPSIGGTITGATAGSVLFANPTNTFAQDNSKFFWDETNKRLGIGTSSPTSQVQIVSQVNTDIGLRYDAAAYTASTSTADHLAFYNHSSQKFFYVDSSECVVCSKYRGDVGTTVFQAGYQGGNNFSVELGATNISNYPNATLLNMHGGYGWVYFPAGGSNMQLRTFNGLDIMPGIISGTAQSCSIIGQAATAIPLVVKGASAQSAHLQEWQNSSSTILSAVTGNGGIQPAHMADSAAANDTIYYSTTASKLVYKDSGGVVNNLY